MVFNFCCFFRTPKFREDEAILTNVFKLPPGKPVLDHKQHELMRK